MNTLVTMTLDDVKELKPLTEEEKTIIKNAKATPTEDCPAQTKEELKHFRPWYETHSQSSDIYEGEKEYNIPNAENVH